MKNKKIISTAVFCMCLLVTYVGLADYKFIDWLSETPYEARVESFFRWEDPEDETQSLIYKEGLADLLHGREYRHYDEKSRIINRLLEQFLERERYNCYIQLLISRREELTEDMRKKHLQKGLSFNREEMLSQGLEDMLRRLYERDFGEDSWLENFEEEVSFKPVNSWTWDNYNYPAYPFKNMNYPFFQKDDTNLALRIIEGEIYLNPEKPLFEITLSFEFSEERDTPLAFALSQRVSELEITSNGASLDYSREEDRVQLDFSEEAQNSFEITYQLQELYHDDTGYLGTIFGFMNAPSLLLPRFDERVSSAVDITVKGKDGIACLLPGYHEVITAETDSIRYQNDEIEYSRLFVAYTPEGRLRKRSMESDGSTVDILTYRPLSSYVVRVRNLLNRLNLSFEPLLLVALPTVDSQIYYPGLGIINEGNIKNQSNVLYMHFAHAVFQSELFTSSVREGYEPLLGGFIENTAAKAVEMVVPSHIKNYRKGLQEIYQQQFDLVTGDSLLSTIFEANVFYNYVCGRDFANNRALYNYLRHHSEEEFVSAGREHFQTGERDPWWQLVHSWAENGYLPQFYIGNAHFIIWSNLKQELRALLTKRDITFPVPVEVRIFTHDGDELTRNFVIHRVSSLFVFPTAREVTKLEMDPFHYYLKHPDHIDNYTREITRDMYEHRPASGMFR